MNQEELKKYVFSKNFIFGIYFLCIQCLIFFAIPLEHLNLFLWFCNHTPLLISVCFFMNKIQPIKALICIGFIPQLVWVIDFYIQLLFGVYIFGVTEIVFERSNYQILFGAINHTFTTFVALYAVYKIPVKKEAYFYSIGYSLLLFIVTLLLTNLNLNINCLDFICGFETLTPPLYTFLWPLYSFILLFIPILFLQQEIYLLTQRFKISKK